MGRRRSWSACSWTLPPPVFGMMAVGMSHFQTREGKLGPRMCVSRTRMTDGRSWLLTERKGAAAQGGGEAGGVVLSKLAMSKAAGKVAATQPDLSGGGSGGGRHGCSRR